MKNTAKQVRDALLLIVLAFALPLGIKLLLNALCERTNSLLCIWLDMLTDGAFYLFAVCLVTAVWFVVNSFRTVCADLRQALRDRAFRIALTGILLILIVPQFFGYSRRFANIMLGGKKPMRLQYGFALLCDVCSGKTRQITLDAAAVTVDTHRYLSGGGSRFGTTGHVSTAYYACYGDSSVYLYDPVLYPYLTLCQEYQRQVEIVYYPHSGIIQSVDGIALYDKSAFQRAADTLRQEEADRAAAEQAAAQEAQEKELAVFRAFFESEGENYERIVRELAAKGLTHSYDVIPISTQYYDIGDVAFFDNEARAVYVVQDNDREDMVLVPQLPYPCTFAEITQLLDEAGIPWTFDCIGCPENGDAADHARDLVNTVHSASGTPIPRDYVLWFSVIHAE